MPRPLPKQPRPRTPEVTVEGLQYKVHKWVDDAVMEVVDSLGRYGEVVEDEDMIFLNTPDGKRFRISITTTVEVE